jgi:hypothetical protein
MTAFFVPRSNEFDSPGRALPATKTLRHFAGLGVVRICRCDGRSCR